MQTAKRILLVEDDPDDQDLFCEALKLIHSQILCEIANDGVKALHMVEHQSPFDLIFLDLNLPKMDGFECLWHLKNNELHKNIPVIILSTSHRLSDIERCKKLGAANFFSKPASFDKLFHMLENILSNRMST